MRFNEIFYNRGYLHNNYKRLLNTLFKRGYNKTNTTTKINLAIAIPRKELLYKNKASNTERLPLTVTCNSTISDFNRIIDRNCHILQIESKLKEILLNLQFWHSKETTTLKT